MSRRLKRGQIAKLVKQPGIRAHRNSLRYRMRIKKGDTVQVISGDERGAIGEVIAVLPSRNMVVVEGINIVTRHLKPQRDNEPGRIDTREGPIHVSNVMAYSKKNEVASKIAYTFTPEGRKVRMLKETGEILD